MASSNPTLAQEKTSELSVYFENLQKLKITDQILGKIEKLSVRDLENVLAYMEMLEGYNTQEDQELDQDQEESIWTKDYYQDCYNPKKEY